MDNKNKTAYIWLLVLLVLGFFAYAMWRPSARSTQTTDAIEDATNQNNATTPYTPQTNTDSTTQPANTTTTAAKEFTLKASKYTFDIKEIKVKQGDTVKITLENTDGTHDWRLDEFNAQTKVLQTGEKETITFVADKKGTFEYYCSIGQHRAMGMKGNFIVE